MVLLNLSPPLPPAEPTPLVAAMRFSASAIALLVAGASALSVRSDGQSLARRDEFDVPGQSPLKFCEADRANDIITIDEVVLTPNPPQA